MAGKIQILVLVLVLYAAPAAAEPGIQEGSWEITTVTEMAGIAMKMKPQTHRQCLTKDDFVPKDPQAPSSCVVKDQRVSGTTVTWTMECSSDGVKTISVGTVTFSGDTFSGKVDISMSGTDMKVVSTMTGRRLGACEQVR